MSTETICLLVSVGVLILAMIYLDIVDGRWAKIKELAEEQGWCDPAKVQELGERREPSRRRRKQTPAPAVMDAQYFTMPDGEKVRRR